MKVILMSIRPQWVAKILNGDKTIEIRKKFPKDYVGWVYIYVTKALPHLSKTYVGDYEVYDDTQWDKEWLDLNGKVVARFWCDKVEEIICRPFCGEWECYTKSLGYSEISQGSCLKNREIVSYLKGKNGTAIHITKLEIFDKPKELWKFDRCILTEDLSHDNIVHIHQRFKITKAPQNYCYIEV